MNFLIFIKKIIKNIIYLFLNRENKKIKFLSNKLLSNRLHVLDIGAYQMKNLSKFVKSDVYCYLNAFIINEKKSIRCQK